MMWLLVGAKCGVSWGLSWTGGAGWVIAWVIDVAMAWEWGESVDVTAWVWDGLDNEVEGRSSVVGMWVGGPPPDIGRFKLFLDRDDVVNEVHCWTVPKIAVGSSVGEADERDLKSSKRKHVFIKNNMARNINTTSDGVQALIAFVIKTIA